MEGTGSTGVGLSDMIVKILQKERSSLVYVVVKILRMMRLLYLSRK